MAWSRKSKVSSLLTGLQILLLAAGGAVEYFTRHRMGMNRHVVAQNFYWAQTYPLGAVTALGGVLLAALFFVLAFRGRKVWRLALWCAAYLLFSFLSPERLLTAYQHRILFLLLGMSEAVRLVWDGKK